MTIKFLDLAAQFASIEAEMRAAMDAVIRDTAFISGKYARAFEEQYAQFQGTAHCVGVGNGTDALEIALEALALPPGSEVVVPANSFIATGEAVTRAGHSVAFCDCDPDTFTIDVADLERRITERTAAVIPVHLYGQPCDMDPILELAARHDLRVLEDCAQAHGAEYRGRRVGGIGDIGTFSFYPGKNLGAYGDAGAIVCQDPALAKRARMIANHGRIEKYNHEFEGRNSRLDGLQGAILSVKLRHLEDWLEARRHWAAAYRRLLADCGDLLLPREEEWARHVYHLFVIRTERRDELRASLAAADIQTGIHYPISLPRLQAYRHLGMADAPLVANSLADRILSLPMGEHLTEAAVEEVCSVVRDFCRHSSRA